MNRNVGTIDRILRIGVGLLLILLAVSGAIGLWGWIGVLPLITGVMSWCPGYSVLGVNTCGARTRTP